MSISRSNIAISRISKFDLKAYKLIRSNVSSFIESQARVYDHCSINVLDIAPQVHEGASAFFKHATVETADIDVKSDATYIVDICHNNSKIIPSDHFDIVVCTEVLEHTLNPFSAVNELFRVLKPKGLLLASTPFNFRIHGPLPDCWRFTEHGLRSLFSHFSSADIVPLENPKRFLMPYHYTIRATK